MAPVIPPHTLAGDEMRDASTQHGVKVPDPQYKTNPYDHATTVPVREAIQIQTLNKRLDPHLIAELVGIHKS